MKSRPSVEKRRKELARQERKREKAVRRAERKTEKAQGISSGGDELEFVLDGAEAEGAEAEGAAAEAESAPSVESPAASYLSASVPPGGPGHPATAADFAPPSFGEEKRDAG